MRKLAFWCRFQQTPTFLVFQLILAKQCVSMHAFRGLFSLIFEAEARSGYG